MTLTALSIAAPAAIAQRYDIVRLEYPPTYFTFELGDMNDSGEIVGTAWWEVPGAYFTGAVFWDANGEMQTLPYLQWENPRRSALTGDREASAWGINNLGQIVGQSDGRIYGQYAVLWSAGAHEITDLLDRDSIAYAINDQGVVVGSFAVGWLSAEAFRWQKGQWQSLYPMLVAKGINNAGQIVGYGGSRAYLWQDGQVTMLPGIGGAETARGISDLGQVVGAVSDIYGEVFPASWKGGVVRASPHFGANGTLVSVNDDGVAVGWCTIDLITSNLPSVLHRNNFLMSLIDLMTDPPGGDWKFYKTAKINNAGQIATILYSQNEHVFYPVRLDPVDVGLTLWGIEPSRPGRRNVVQVNHATPGGRVLLLWGTQRVDPQPFDHCHGAMIDLADPHLAAIATAGPDGVAEFNIYVPASADGQTYIFQAVDHTTCEVSPPAWALFKMVN